MTTENETAFFACYDWAIIRVVTGLPVSGDSNPPLLVFASVELVHSDRPRPDSTRLDERGIPPHTRGHGPSGVRVYYRRVALAAADALQWYRYVANGTRIVPIPSAPEERGRYDGSPLRGPALIDEPPWPKLAFPMVDSSLFAGSNATYPVPFLGPGAAPARIHRLMAAADPDLELLSHDPVACKWLAPRIYFRIDDYPELLGAAVLIAPDPQVAGVQTILHARSRERASRDSCGAARQAKRSRTRPDGVRRKIWNHFYISARIGSGGRHRRDGAAGGD